jgi:hypothetical protein
MAPVCVVDDRADVCLRQSAARASDTVYAQALLALKRAVPKSSMAIRTPKSLISPRRRAVSSTLLVHHRPGRELRGGDTGPYAAPARQGAVDQDGRGPGHLPARGARPARRPAAGSPTATCAPRSALARASASGGRRIASRTKSETVMCRRQASSSITFRSSVLSCTAVSCERSLLTGACPLQAAAAAPLRMIVRYRTHGTAVVVRWARGASMSVGGDDSGASAHVRASWPCSQRVFLTAARIVA